MKIWVSNEHETLRIMAGINHIPDQVITGQPVNLPDTELDIGIQSRPAPSGAIPACLITPAQTLSN